MKLIHSGSLRSGVISQPCQERLGFGYRGLISTGIVEHKLFIFYIEIYYFCLQFKKKFTEI